MIDPPGLATSKEAPMQPLLRLPGTAQRSRRASLRRAPVAIATAFVACFAGVPASARRPDGTSTPATPLLSARREAGTGAASLHVDERALAQRGRAIAVTYFGLCKFDPTKNSWARVPLALPSVAIRFAPEVSRAVPGRRVLDLAGRPAGLYWIQWSAWDDVPAKGEGVGERRAPSSTLLHHGRVLCNDVHLGPAPQGRFAACVPGDTEAVARFVPDPERACAVRRSPGR
jgi:hypothetical protein